MHWSSTFLGKFLINLANWSNTKQNNSLWDTENVYLINDFVRVLGIASSMDHTLHHDGSCSADFRANFLLKTFINVCKMTTISRYLSLIVKLGWTYVLMFTKVFFKMQCTPLESGNKLVIRNASETLIVELCTTGTNLACMKTIELSNGCRSEVSTDRVQKEKRSAFVHGTHLRCNGQLFVFVFNICIEASHFIVSLCRLARRVPWSHSP